jgi:YVTN family beta-propeller protein
MKKSIFGWQEKHAMQRTTALLFTALVLTGGVSGATAELTHPTHSSPIALSADNTLLWSVNPDADSVSVIRTDTHQVVTTIGVGDEPQSVALDPDNCYAYVANAAAGTVTAIEITNPDPNQFAARVQRTVTTGAEPWHVVVSRTAGGSLWRTAARTPSRSCGAIRASGRSSGMWICATACATTPSASATFSRAVWR